MRKPHLYLGDVREDVYYDDGDAGQGGGEDGQEQAAEMSDAHVETIDR